VYILNTNNEEALGPGFAAGWFNGLIGLFTKQRGYEVNFPIGELPDGSYGPVSMGATVSTRLIRWHPEVVEILKKSVAIRRLSTILALICIALIFRDFFVALFRALFAF
jgi:hypothetical protein